MSGSKNNLYIPPSAEADYAGWRPPRQGDGHTNIPTVIALMLSIFLFAVFLWFFLSPLCMPRGGSPPRPIDLEDAYFINSERTMRASSFFAGGGLQKAPAINSRSRTLMTPPPAYTAGRARQMYPSPSDAHTFPTRCAPGSGRASASGSLRRLFNLARSASAPPVISKPIPLPESPLPGPDINVVEIQRISRASSMDPLTERTIIHPCTAPRSVSASMLHFPELYIPAPSQAVVHSHGNILRRSLTVQVNRPISESDARRSADASNYRKSSSLFTIPAEINLDTSVASSRIGMAF